MLCRATPQKPALRTRISSHNVLKYGLKPIPRKLKIPSQNAGLHAFRHGLATELAERAVPLPVLQKQMRHADVRTTLRIYAHAIPDTQRNAMENLAAANQYIVTNDTKTQGQPVSAESVGGSVWESKGHTNQLRLGPSRRCNPTLLPIGTNGTS
jgi:hypothetical protein